MVPKENKFSVRLSSCLDRIGWHERGRPARMQKELSQKGWTLSVKACQKWFNDEGMPDTKKLDDIADIAQTTVEFLITGRPAANNVAEPHASYKTKSIPVISYVQAGDWAEAIDNFQPGDAEDWISIDGSFGPHAFALIVKGDSMTSPTPPSVPHGSKIVVDPDVQAEHSSLVVAKLIDTNEVTFKRLVIDGTRKYLEPLNPRYQPIEINGNCQILGVVRRAVLDF